MSDFQLLIFVNITMVLQGEDMAFDTPELYLNRIDQVVSLMVKMNNTISIICSFAAAIHSGRVFRGKSVSCLKVERQDIDPEHLIKWRTLQMSVFLSVVSADLMIP